MAASNAASGSQTATLNTNHTVVTQTAPTGGASYQFVIDTANLVNGERLLVRMQSSVFNGQTLRDTYTSTFMHVQSQPVKPSPIISLDAGNQVSVIIRQEGGTGRVFPWALRRVDG